MRLMRYEINSPQVITEMIDGEAIMINLSTGNYYSISGSGADIWQGIVDGVDTDDIVQALVDHHAAAPEVVQAGVESLVSDLVREELVVATSVEPGEAPSVRPESSPSQNGFRPPVLEKYTDMQDLVLLDPVHEVDAAGWPHPKPPAGN
jgi:hypothetical protein